MTSDRGAGSAAAEPVPRPRTRFGPEPILLFPLSLALIGAVPLAATVWWLRWLVVLPLLGAVWVLRARVRAEPDGLVVSNGLRRRRVAWDDVQGFDVPRRGPVRLLHAGSDGSQRRTPLLALPRRELPRLVAAAEAVAGPGRAGPPA